MKGNVYNHRAIDTYGHSNETDLAFALDDFLEKLEVRGYSPSSIRLRRWMLGEFLQYAKNKEITDARDVTGAMLREYIVRLSRIPTKHWKRERYSPGVITSAAVSLRMFFRHLAKRGYLLYDPARGLEKIKERSAPPVPLTPLQAERVLSLPDTQTAAGLRDRAILELFYNTGMRRSELANLRVEDVRFESGTIFIREGKGRRDRVVPVGERARMWLRRYLEDARPVLHGRAKRGVENEILFLNQYGRRLEATILTKIVAGYMRRSGFERGSCHLLRHTCATEMLSNGADIVHIQELLGHDQIRTSETYTHISPERLREKYSRSHPSVFAQMSVLSVHGGGRQRLRKNRESVRVFVPVKKREFPVRGEIDRAIHDYLESRGLELSSRSVESFRHYLYNFSGWCFENGVKGVLQITVTLLEGYQKFLSRRKSKKNPADVISLKTQKYEMETVCAFVRWCHGRGLLLSDPSAAIELPRAGRSLVADCLTREDVERVLALPDPKSPYGLRDRAMLEVLYATGIRSSEFCNLKVGDADFERDSLRITASKQGRDRVIPVSGRAMKWLYRYVCDVREECLRENLAEERGGALFLTESGRPFHKGNMDFLCKKYLRLAGIAKGSVHIFRHTCATHMIENGADLRTVQEFLGHKSIESTRVYAHISIRTLKKVHAETHPAEKRYLERLRMTEEEREEAERDEKSVNGDTGTEAKGI